MDAEKKFIGEPEVARSLLAHVNEQLAGGVTSADLAFCLAYVALDLAFHSAPSPADAMMLVSSALSHASEANRPQSADDSAADCADSRAPDGLWDHSAGIASTSETIH